MRGQSQNSNSVSGDNVILNILGWPLRQLMKFALDHPLLLQKATRIAHKVPFLYNGLLRYAQRSSIVLAPEETGSDPFEINHPDELTASGKEIYLKLKAACENCREGGG